MGAGMYVHSENDRLEMWLLSGGGGGGCYTKSQDLNLIIFRLKKRNTESAVWSTSIAHLV